MCACSHLHSDLFRKSLCKYCNEINIRAEHKEAHTINAADSPPWRQIGIISQDRRRQGWTSPRSEPADPSFQWGMIFFGGLGGGVFKKVASFQWMCFRGQGLPSEWFLLCLHLKRCAPGDVRTRKALPSHLGAHTCYEWGSFVLGAPSPGPEGILRNIIAHTDLI